MKLFLCFALTSLACLVTNGKKIKIQIESEDLVNIFEGVMYSEVLQKFANALAKKREDKRPLDNPYHPEDELLDHFNTDVDKEIEYVNPTNPKQDFLFDSLEDQNEHFENGNNVESGDILTENEMKPEDESIVKRNSEKITSNTPRNTTDENMELKKKMYDAVNDISISPNKKIRNVKKKIEDDRANFKPVQRRFVLKGSKDTLMP